MAAFCCSDWQTEMDLQVKELHQGWPDASLFY
jgi:hypothetical protein